MIIFIVPKNEGLKSCKNLVETLPKAPIQYMWGEDIPFFVEILIKKDKNAIGITGEDFLKEYLLNVRDSNLTILQRIPWQEKSALFGKPVLCLLGPKGKTLEKFPKNLRVAMNKKYAMISKKFLSQLQYRYGITFEKMYFSGSTEEVFVNGLADLVIDIVFSGKSAIEAGLEVYDKIFESDIVVIGKKETLLNPNKLNNALEKR